MNHKSGGELTERNYYTECGFERWYSLLPDRKSWSVVVRYLTKTLDLAELTQMGVHCIRFLPGHAAHIL